MLLLKTLHTVATGYIESNFKTIRILSPCLLVILVLENTLQAAGEKDISGLTQHWTLQAAIYQVRCTCWYNGCVTVMG